MLFKRLHEDGLDAYFSFVYEEVPERLPEPIQMPHIGSNPHMHYGIPLGLDKGNKDE